MSQSTSASTVTILSVHAQYHLQRADESLSTMVNLPIVASPSTTFHCFNAMPLEIQRMIWKNALQPRIVEINFLYNPEIDLLYISHRTRINFRRQDVFGALRQSGSLQKVRTIALDYLGDSDATIPGWDIDPLPLSEMKKLELIFVVLEDWEDPRGAFTPFALDPTIEPNYIQADLDLLVALVDREWRKVSAEPAPRVVFVWERGY
ncbi:hypothetical protein EG329_012905 [Mollisiaceae sp. DMI_Dod_QoI]|nr:hypothetical protein EG329_012905 [Helotiales sp. DMI_Dod_QoI]